MLFFQAVEYTIWQNTSIGNGIVLMVQQDTDNHRIF